MVRNVYTSGPYQHAKYGFSVSNITLSDNSQELVMTYNFRGGYVKFLYNNARNQTERRSEHNSSTPKYIRKKLLELANRNNTKLMNIPFMRAVVKLIDYNCEIIINNHMTSVVGNVITYEGLETHEPFRNLGLIKEYGRLLKDIKYQIKTMSLDDLSEKCEKVALGEVFPEYHLTLNLKPTR